MPSFTFTVSFDFPRWEPYAIDGRSPGKSDNRELKNHPKLGTTILIVFDFQGIQIYIYIV